MKRYLSILRNTEYSNPWRRIVQFATLVIAILLPRRYWYKTAWFLSGFLLVFFRRSLVKKHSPRFLRAKTLNTILALLTRTGNDFPIHYSLSGQELLTSENGVAIASVHLPLVKVSIAGLMHQNIALHAAVAGRETIDDHMAFWGHHAKLPVIYRNAQVLLKAKTILQQKGRLVLMIDRGLNGGYSDHMLRICQKTNSKILFALAALDDNGCINCSIVTPPFPFCDNDEAIAANLHFLDAEVSKVLMQYHHASVL